MMTCIIAFVIGFLIVAGPAFIHDVRERKRLGLKKYFWSK